MIERAPIAPIAEQPKLLERHEAQPLLTERSQDQRPGQLQERVEQVKTAETARAVIEQSASSLNALEQHQAQEAATAAPAPTYVNRELKSITLRRELKLIQRQQSPAARTLSQVIHQPAVRVASEAAGKTVSRPSGLLGAGLLAFVGSSSYLYLTKHYGFDYNFFVFFVLFAGGFAAGLALELAIWLVTRRQTSLT